MLLTAVSQAMRAFVADADPRASFEALLSAVLGVTSSDYGFIGEVHAAPDGAPLLRTYAISDVTSLDEARPRGTRPDSAGSELRDLHSLFGAVLVTGEPILVNDVPGEARRPGAPDGHPPLRSLLGLPLHHAGQLVGMIGIANRPDGYRQSTIFELETLLSACGALIVGYREVDRRRAAEAALRASEARMRGVFAAMRDKAFEIDRDGVVRAFLGGPAHLLANPPGKSLGKTMADVLPASVAEPALAAIRQALDSGQVQRFEYALTVAAGPRWFEARVAPLATLEGETPSAVVVARDISERKLSDLDLEESLARLRGVVDSDLAAIAFWLPDGHIVRANRAFLTLIGREASALDGTGLSWASLVDPGHDAPSVRFLRDIAAHGRCPAFETELVHASGRKIPVLAGATALGARGTELAAFVLDMSERRRLEDQLRHGQRMESIGRLAGGIAHDFNNLLLVISASANLIAGDLPPDAPAQPELADILAAATRAAELTRQLLAFSRRQIFEIKLLELSQTASALGPMLARALGEHIRLSQVLEAGGSVLADAGQIEQVLLHLALNARDAMPDGGSVTIETRDVQVGPELEHHPPDAAPGPYVLLAMRDTGAGMTREVREHAFDPFFTTKAAGQGSGLGLATVYGIVKQSGGAIDVQSEPGRGATFRTYWPRAQGKDAPGGLHKPALAPAKTRRETVLVVEDEASVRKVLCRILKGAGYTVLEASSGPEALRVAGAHSTDIALLVSDVVMPDMNGPMVAEQLRRMRPTLRVLFVSGYSEEAIAHHGVLEAGVNYLPKPFMPDELLEKVRAVLGAAA